MNDKIDRPSPEDFKIFLEGPSISYYTREGYYTPGSIVNRVRRGKRIRSWSI